MTHNELMQANERARRLIERVQDRHLAARMPEMLGIPMPGLPPFVVRKSHLLGQSKGLDTITAQFIGAGDTFLLRIAGTFGEGRGKHSAKIINFRHTAYAYQLRTLQSKWADVQRDKPRPILDSALSPADKVSKRRSRIETKIAQIQQQMAKVTKRAEKSKPSRPWSPLMGNRSQDDAPDYERAIFAAWYAAKPKRKIVSTFAARRPFAKSWPAWYADLATAGIRVTYEYAKCHGWKDGPKSPGEYLHSTKWIGHSPRKPWDMQARDLAAEMIRHQDARRRYLDALKTWKSELSELDSLAAIREGYELELAEMAAKGE